MSDGLPTRTGAAVGSRGVAADEGAEADGAGSTDAADEGDGAGEEPVPVPASEATGGPGATKSAKSKSGW